MERKTKQFYEAIEKAIIDFNDGVDGIVKTETKSGNAGSESYIVHYLKKIKKTEEILKKIKNQKERKEARKTYNRVNTTFTIYTIAEQAVAILYKIFRRR